MLRAMEPSEGTATDLRDALALFDWRNEPRMGPEQLNRYYVKRTSHRALRRVLKQLGEAIRNETCLHALYMGPAGCGKSTDLTWVTQEIVDEQSLDDPLLVLHYDIGDSVGWHDVGFAELALSLALKVHERFAPGQNMPLLDGAHLRKINEWIYGERKETRTQQTEAGVGFDLNLFEYLKVALSTRQVRERQIEMKLRQLMPELRKLLDNLLEEVHKKTDKRVLFIVDGLEKLTPIDAAIALFLNQAGFFGGLDCHLLFTAPSALRLEARYQAEVVNHFMEYRATLGRPVRSDDDSSEYQKLRQIIYRRASPELVEAAAVDRLVMASGGLVAQVIDGMYRAILRAMTDDAARVTLEHVEEELKEISTGYLSMLRDSHYEELDRIEQEGSASHVEDPALLHSRCVLEYPDTPTEFAIHPLVLPLLERWRKAKANQRR
jgi:hypothetical protein